MNESERRLMKYATQKVNIYDICDVQRASGVYDQGTVYLRISATDGKILILDKMQELESKYCVFVPKVVVLPEYLKIAIERTFPEFLEKYVGTNINIQIDAFKWFELEFHFNKEIQRDIVEKLRNIEKSIEAEEEEISKIKEFKRVMLAKMMM